jgi:hypothetical protein
MAVTYTLIGQSTLTSNSSSVTFSGIPATYKDLVLRTSSRDTYTGTTDGFIYVKINTSTNTYSDTVLYGTGSSSSSYRNTAPGNSGFETYGSTAANATANYFGNMEIYIPNYAGSQKKVASSFGAPETQATPFNFGLAIAAGMSSVTDAITQIQVGASVSFVSGSSFYLYGIKNS